LRSGGHDEWSDTTQSIDPSTSACHRALNPSAKTDTTECDCGMIRLPDAWSYARLMAADEDFGEPLQRRDPIKIVPYDGSWPVSFDQQRTRVEGALGSHLVGSVEHIGSTAVPGLPAKPIIDMLGRVADFDATAGIVADMEGIGWVHAPEPGDRALRKVFARPRTGRSRKSTIRRRERASTSPQLSRGTPNRQPWPWW
jgi:GrpB-like predicted nucleotidyltransferase (UPF0157 family)